MFSITRPLKNGKLLDEIQCHAFGGENRARRAGDFQQRLAAVQALAVSDKAFNLDRGRKLGKGARGEFEAGDAERIARTHHSHGHGRFRHGGERGHVAGADVLGERELDGAADFFGTERLHGARMARRRKLEKQKGFPCQVGQ